ncbi:TadE/TadG family type IV pilus assembly protein [Aurantimicrobium minutum]|uniref:TadE/TadG family type IV pilus assembly protein n=1 Tax=Aurantimicrobium minutum TaxID=708131 RepID=UPI002472EE88|nr:TadE/TadG family type IV pilus assembly protein [Aurantimicrobium minutum]
MLERIRAEESGSAVVEFVFVGILLTFLTLGVLQLGLALHVRNTIQDAASEGARWGALIDSTPAEGAQRTKELITTAVGEQYARNISVSSQQWLGTPATVITVKAPLPVIGLWGPATSLEVSGHAATEVLG